tara:strand:- start:5560 stop:5745 length:186 start_codon:yes stop_codon:yes gene_type:complete
MVVWKGVMEKDGHSIYFDVQQEDVIVTETWHDNMLQPVSLSITDAISKQKTLEQMGYEFTR